MIMTITTIVAITPNTIPIVVDLDLLDPAFGDGDKGGVNDEEFNFKKALPVG